MADARHMQYMQCSEIGPKSWHLHCPATGIWPSATLASPREITIVWIAENIIVARCRWVVDSEVGV